MRSIKLKFFAAIFAAVLTVVTTNAAFANISGPAPFSGKLIFLLTDLHGFTLSGGGETRATYTITGKQVCISIYSSWSVTNTSVFNTSYFDLAPYGLPVATTFGSYQGGAITTNGTTGAIIGGGYVKKGTAQLYPAAYTAGTNTVNVFTCYWSS
jgi:hypothetical protein